MNIFCAHFYSDGERIFSNISSNGFLDAVKSPYTFVAIINLIGIFKCPKYTKKYIYPSFVFYFIFIITALFSQSSRACEVSVLPAMFIGFAALIIHQRFFRKCFRIIVILILITTICLSVVNIKNIIGFSTEAKNVVAEEISAEDEIDKIIPAESIVYMDNASIKEVYVLIPRYVVIMDKIPENAKFIISHRDKIDNYEFSGKYSIEGKEKNIFVKKE